MRRFASTLAIVTACAAPRPTPAPTAVTSVSSTPAVSAPSSVVASPPAPALVPTRPSLADALLWRSAALRQAAIVEGGVFALTSGCALVELDPATGALSNERTLADARDGRAGRCEHRFVGDGLVLSRNDGSLELVSPRARRIVAQVGPPPASTAWTWAAARGRLFVADRYERRMERLPPNLLRAFEGRASAPAWTASLGQNEDPRSIVVTDRGVVVATTTAGASTGTLSSFDPATGVRQWFRGELAGPAIVAAEGSRLLVRSAGLRLVDARTGVDVWRVDVGQTHAIAIGLRGAYVVERSLAADELVVLDLSDGHVRTRTSLSDRVTSTGDTALVALGSRVFVRAGGAVLAVDADAGREGWSFALGHEHTRLDALSSGGAVLLFTGDGTDGTVAFDPDAPLPPHDVIVNGIVRHAPDSAAKAASLEGLEVHAAGASTKVDARSRFTLALRGRGRAAVTVGDRAWLSAHGSMKCPAGTYFCGGSDAAFVDLEAPGPRPITITWGARCCGIH